MMVAAVVLGSVLLMPVREQDIPWFMAHPQERHDALRYCRDDHRADRRVCLNADRADMRSKALAAKPSIDRGLEEIFRRLGSRNTGKAAGRGI